MFTDASVVFDEQVDVERGLVHDELENALKSSQQPEELRSPETLAQHKSTMNISREDLSEGRGSLLSSPDVNLPLSPTPSDADSGIYSSKADHQRSDSGQSSVYSLQSFKSLNSSAKKVIDFGFF